MRNHLQRSGDNVEIQLPVLVGNIPGAPTRSLVFSGNFLHLLFGQLDDHRIVRLFRLRNRFGGKFSKPDVSVPDRVPVVLKGEGASAFTSGISMVLQPRCRTERLHVVLDEDTVVENGEASRLIDLPFLGELRCPKDDVVGLPFPRFATDIDEWRKLTIDGSRLAVGIGLVLVGIENLNFKQALQKNSAVAPPLPPP